MAIKIAMIPITTSNSMRVNPSPLFFRSDRFIRLTPQIRLEHPSFIKAAFQILAAASHFAREFRNRLKIAAANKNCLLLQSIEFLILFRLDIISNLGGQMRSVKQMLALAGSVTLVLGSALRAGTIDNSTVQIVGGTPAYHTGDYPQIDALDSAPNTDYASEGGGSSTFLTFKFPTQETFTQITETDRVTSGGPNGAFFGGTGEFNTGYSYIFSNDPNFTTIVGQVDVTRPVPANPTSSAADFTTATSIPNITAQYVKWQVTANDGGAGANSGAENFIFSVSSAASTPLPASALSGLVLLGGLAASTLCRRKAMRA